MTAAIAALVFIIWAMMFYLGFLLIDIKSDLRRVRQDMERISRSRIR